MRYMTTLSPSGFLRIGASDLEYRMIGPRPADAPTIVMLHEGLGSAGAVGRFSGKAAGRDRRRRVRLFARRLWRLDAGASCRARSTTCMSRRSMCCRSCSMRSAFAAGFLLGHSDGASIAAIYAGGVGITACAAW